MIGATSEAGTANTSGSHEFTPCFAQSLGFCVVFVDHCFVVFLLVT
jgi:hypothetical protein